MVKRSSLDDPLTAKRFLTQLPTFPRHAAEEAVGGFVVGDAHGFGTPHDLATGAMGDVAEMIGFGERAGVAEGAAGGRAVADGGQKFGVLAGGVSDEGFRALEVFEGGFRSSRCLP